MTPEEIAARVTKCLSDIDDPSVDVIAVRLEERGIKGVPGSRCDCILARYLKKEVPEWDDDITVWPKLLRQGHVRVGGVVVGLPEGTNNLAFLFDDRIFPGLIDEAAEKEGLA